MAGSRKGPNVHVVPTHTSKGTRLVVEEAGNPRPLTRPTTQEKAIERAVPRAKEHRSDVVIHRPTGEIRDRDS